MNVIIVPNKTSTTKIQYKKIIKIPTPSTLLTLLVQDKGLKLEPLENCNVPAISPKAATFDKYNGI
jgi:hypothetical protein